MIGERFTRAARQAVHEAVVQAERLDAPEIGPEHLALALLDAPVLAEFGLARDEVVEAFAAARRKGGLSDADTEALRRLGIDVDQIVASVERTHGEGALAGAPTGDGGGSSATTCRSRRRRRRRWSAAWSKHATSATARSARSTWCWRCWRNAGSWPRCWRRAV